MRDDLGLFDKVELSAKQEAKLKAAYKNLVRGKGKTEKTLYNDISELGGLALEIFDRKGRVAWTSTGHTAANVPVFAIGVGAERFTGWYDNTEIVKKIKAGR